MTLLIVDDDVLFVQSLQKSMDWKALGLTLLGTAVNGQEGLRLYRKLHPDILLCDVQMPVMNGIEMVQRIMEEDRASNSCLVVFMTAYSEREYLKSAIKLRAVDYLDKPFSPEELSEILLRVTRQQRSAGDRAGYSKPVEMTIAYIQSHYAQPLTIETLADQVYLTPNYFSAIFKRETGKTVLTYLTEQRMAKACFHLKTSNLPLGQVAAHVGYQDFRYFSHIFHRVVGLTPSEYRKRG